MCAFKLIYDLSIENCTLSDAVCEISKECKSDDRMIKKSGSWACIAEPTLAVLNSMYTGSQNSVTIEFYR